MQVNVDFFKSYIPATLYIVHYYIIHPLTVTKQ